MACYLAVQIAGHDVLKTQGIVPHPGLCPGSLPRGHTDHRPAAPVAGSHRAVREASIVAKLKAAGDRKRARDGKCEGRRSHREINPELVALVKNRLA
jgi:hypothetical protein